MYKQYFYNNLKHKIFYNCFYYDVKSCSLRLIKQMGYLKIYNSLSKLPKQERNIRIGTLLKNKTLSKEFNNRIIQLMNDFIEEHEINKDDILFIQKDGLLLKKFIKIKNLKKIYPELRNIFSYVIFGNKNDMYLSKDAYSNEFVIKGVYNKTLGLEEFFKDNLKTMDINNLKNINDLIIKFYKSSNLRLFMIQDKKNPNLFDIILKDSILTINENQLKLYQSDSIINKIDKNIYFNNLLEPFVNTIILNNLA